MNKHILVLAYKFPPYEAVGARRWAKFPKYFAEKGYTVHIITNNWKITTSRSWMGDVTGKPGISIVKLQTSFNALRSGNTFLNKFVNKAEHLSGKALHWTDEAYSFYSFNFEKIMDYIRHHKIETVIATGGPFSANYFASKIKEKMPRIKLVHDFRDMWTEEYFFEYPNRKAEDWIYKKEAEMEKYSLSHCDMVVSVTPGCVSRFQKQALNYGITQPKYALVENGYDESEKKEFSPADYPSGVFNKNDLNIAHFGTAAFSREEQFYEFLLSVKERLLASPVKIRFHFFGYFTPSRKEQILASEFKDSVKFYDFLPSSEVQKYMYFADLHLIINDKVYHYAYGSKVFDAFMYRKPVLLICEKESLYDMVVQNNIGLATNNSKAENDVLMEKLTANHEAVRNGAMFSKSFDYTQFSIRQLTQKYIDALNTLL